MKPVSNSLATAIEAGERVVFHDFQIDWDNDGFDGEKSIDDVTSKVASLTKKHALTSDLPTQVQLTPGVAVANLDARLGGGNIAQYAIPASYKSVTTASSGSSTTSVTATVAKPTGAQVGDVIIVAVVTGTILASTLGLTGYTNVNWATLALRGDGLSNGSLNAYLLTRRVVVGEPDVYTFDIGRAHVWSATAIRIGDPYILGVHQYSSKGRDDGATPTNVATGVAITTTLPTTVISIFTADSGPIVTGSWIANPNDTERADFTTNAATGGHNISTMVASRDNVPAGAFTASATFSGVVDATVVFTIALAGRVSGDERQHAAWTFSELNPLSAYAGKIRSGRKTQWKVGFAGSAGVEYVTTFTGQTLDGGASSRNRVANISALDNRETLRNPALINMRIFLAVWPIPDPFDPQDRFPGLEATYIVSYLLANAFRSPLTTVVTPRLTKRGYFASYPPHRGTILWAPLHGSMEAFDSSTIVLAYALQSTGLRRRVRFARGPFVASTEITERAPGGIFTRWSNFSLDHTFVEATTQSAGRIQYMIRRNSSDSYGLVQQFATDDELTWSALETRLAGALRLHLRTTAGVLRVVDGPTVPADGLWHFVGVHWNSIAANATFLIDGAATNVAFAAWTNTAMTSSSFSIAYATATNGAQIAEIQIMTGVTLDGRADSGVITATDPWSYDTFTPTAFIDKSALTLDALPRIAPETDIWELITEIAQTEFAANYFDDNGYPHYRTAYIDSTTTGQTVQKALTARAHLKDLSYTSSIRQVANSISVGYEPLFFHIDEEAWRAPGAILIAPGSSFHIIIRMPGMVLDSTGVNIASANTLADGTGTVVSTGYTSQVNLGSGAELYDIEITITNNNIMNLWFVDSSGIPTPFVNASWVAPTNAEIGPETAVNTDSTRMYQIQPLSIISSSWRQQNVVADSQAVQLAAQLGQPKPILDEVPIVGDPRLEFGDLVTVSDVNGLGVQGGYRITGLTTAVDRSGGLTQEVTLRQAGTVAIWNVSLWDSTDIWGA